MHSMHCFCTALVFYTTVYSEQCQRTSMHINKRVTMHGVELQETGLHVEYTYADVPALHVVSYYWLVGWVSAYMNCKHINVLHC